MRFSRSAKPWLGLFALSPLALGLTLKAPANSSAYNKGLHFWRLSGRVENGAACANCHGPDGIELAAYNFDDADIMRRAKVHLSDADSRQVVNFIHAVREKYGMTKLLDPMKDRPFQPGGAVLPGATPNERDTAFGEELKQKLPILFNGRIQTIAQAKEAAKDLLALDPWTLKVGIPLSRLSEDVAHGVEHATINQWLPETPPTISPEKLNDWYAAEDEYLAAPSIPALRKLIALHEQLTFSPAIGIETVANIKYRALLLLDYRLRTKNTSGPEPPVAPEIVTPGRPNPAWEVADIARDLEAQNEHTLGMTETLANEKTGPQNTHEQISQLSVSWFWLGWLFDQGMYRSLGGLNTTHGAWLTRALWIYGPYPIHNVYSSTRRQLVASYVPGALLGPPSYNHLRWDYSSLRVGHRYIDLIPKDPTQRKLYLTFTANCFRMNLLLLEDNMRTTGKVWLKPNTISNAKQLTDLIKIADPAHAAEAQREEDTIDKLVDKSIDQNYD
jgi:hypothetical protein